jgi:4-hydroxybenzoyl-CoA reductase subunit beta
MMRLPSYRYRAPKAVEEAAAWLAESPGDTMLLAGGTDLIPNMKRRQQTPSTVVGLRGIPELRAMTNGRGLAIGAGVTLTTLVHDRTVRAQYTGLWQAAAQVATPHIRNMGTIGGNLNLDTRCRYVNQTKFWRQAIGGGCLKSEGNVCHVVPGGRNCVAAMSSDCVPVLISLGAEVVLAGPNGARVIAAEKYFKADGIRHTVREDGELTTQIRVPVPKGPRRSAYAKWTVRKSIDFPLVSVALRFDLGEDSVHSEITAAAVVVGVLGAKPRVVTGLDDAIGKKLSDPAVARIVSQAVHKQCKPLENVPYEAAYRRRMLEVYSRRAIEGLVAGG